jgi:hypothetical protein
MYRCIQILPQRALLPIGRLVFFATEDSLK